MAAPFKIEIFSVTGDPEGIRVISKTNWSGVGVVFPKEQIAELKKHDFLVDYMSRAGVYFLIGDVSEQAIYIGEADPVADRLKQHTNRSDWQWAVFFIDALHGLGKTEVQYLEAALLNLAHETSTAVILNKSKPTYPNMSPADKAAVSVFLSELLSIVPLIGIRAFTPARSAKEESVPADTPQHAFDTIIVPAREDGFKDVFLGKDCWYSIKMQQKHIPQIKFIAAYVTAPTSAITHVAEVARIEPYEPDPDYYIVRFKAPATPLEAPVPLSDGGIKVVPRSPRYTEYKRLMKAKKLAEVWRS